MGFKRENFLTLRGFSRSSMKPCLRVSPHAAADAFDTSRIDLSTFRVYDANNLLLHIWRFLRLTSTSFFFDRCVKVLENYIISVFQVIKSVYLKFWRENARSSCVFESRLKILLQPIFFETDVIIFYHRDQEIFWVREIAVSLNHGFYHFLKFTNDWIFSS